MKNFVSTVIYDEYGIELVYDAPHEEGVRVGGRMIFTGMYCPMCGKLMKENDGAFECVSGNMPLSEDMARHLHASFVSKSEEPEDFTFKNGHRWGGNWFCPGCGVAMREETPGAVRCPQCRRNIGRYLRSLIELHPHS